MNRRHAFLLSCQDYKNTQDFHKLKFADRDAEILRDTLTSFCDYEASDVIFETASAERALAPRMVLNALEDMVKRTSEGDTILFFFAGHGAFRDDRAYIALPESRLDDIQETGVSLHDISEVLKKSGRFCVRIFDSCHSGIDARSSRAASERFALALNEIENEPGEFVTLASCRHDEESYEDPVTGHGYFTLALCEAIRDIPAGVSVLADRIYADVYDRVVSESEKWGRTQRPVKNGHVCGPGEFAKRKTAPKMAAAHLEDIRTELSLRLATARGSEDRMVKNRKPEVDEVGDVALGAFRLYQDRLSSYVVNPSLQLGSASIIGEGLRSNVVVHFEHLGAQTLHEIRSYEKASDHGYGIVASILQRQPKARGYHLSSYGYDKAVARLSWDGDDYVPSGVVFCYVIPLQTRLYVLIAFAVESVIESKSRFTYTYGNYGELDSDWVAILGSEVERAISLASLRVEESITARLDYLDRERGFSND